MNKKRLEIGKRLLMIWGGISLIIVLLVTGYLAYFVTIGNTTSEDLVSKKDVRFVLNWSGLGDEKIKNVVKSYKSSKSFSGDHLNAYAIEITEVSVNELPNTRTTKWLSINNLPLLIDNAVKLTNRFQNKIPWFPSYKELKNEGYYIHPHSIYCLGISPMSTELVLLKPDGKMIYYIDIKI